jgi:hypothetical protein
VDPVTAAQRSAETIVGLPAGFMMDGATYERGGALGFEGIDFYFLGRGGVLGDVPAAVVVAAFVFFEPGTVETAWERGRKARPPAEAATAFATCAHEWAEAHLPDGVDYGRLAELEEKVVAATSPAGVPLFAGWRRLEPPPSPRARALHLMQVLRELRGGLHGGAVLAEGLGPEEALSVRTPFMANLFGWKEPLPDPAPCKESWERAEEATDRAMARRLAVLEDAERDELVALLDEARQTR